MHSAIFFDNVNEKVIKLMAEEPLDIFTDKPHITISNSVSPEMRQLFGTPIIVEITGYANDGKNEGLSCRVQSIKPEMQAILDRVKLPVITLSIKKGERAANTRRLEFSEFNMPYVCKGYFGGYDDLNNRIILGSNK